MRSVLRFSDLPYISATGVALITIAGAAYNLGFVLRLTSSIFGQFTIIDHINAGMISLSSFLIFSIISGAILFSGLVSGSFLRNVLNRISSKFQSKQDRADRELKEKRYLDRLAENMNHIGLDFSTLPSIVAVVLLVFVSLNESGIFGVLIKLVNLVPIVILFMYLLNVVSEINFRRMILIGMCFVTFSFFMGDISLELASKNNKIFYGDSNVGVVVRAVSNGTFVAESESSEKILFIPEEKTAKIEMKKSRM